MSSITTCINPANGETIGTSPVHSKEQALAAIQQAREAQKIWNTMTIRARVKAMRPIVDYIITNADRLAETISRDNGKVRFDAMAAEVLPAAMATSYYLKHAKHFLKPKKLAAGSIALINKRSTIHRVPFGVIGVISPWNYPFTIPFSEIIMALLAGNGVVFKTASDTQLVGLAIKECIAAAALPEGLFHYVNIPGSLAEEVFLGEQGVNKLFFTGSVGVGKRLMAKAAQHLTPLSLELGGNDAMLVCSDADLERTACGALWGGFSNAGQTCAGIERIYVHKDIYTPFMELLKKKVESLRIGYDDNFEYDMGAMTTAGQVKQVQQHINDATEKGATIFAQASIPENTPGQFLPATVLADVNDSMHVMQEETFGPVVAVQSVDTMDEAIEKANASSLGLTSSVWSKNKRKALKIAKQLQAGAILINDHMMSHGLAETPWGGFKESGVGRTHGEIGFHEMTEPQVIVSDMIDFLKRNPWWHPYDKKIYHSIKSLALLLYHKNIFVKLKALGPVIAMFKRSL